MNWQGGLAVIQKTLKSILPFVVINSKSGNKNEVLSIESGTKKQLQQTQVHAIETGNANII